MRPDSFSYAPVAPNAAPPATSARDWTSIRTTSAETGADTSANTIAARTACRSNAVMRSSSIERTRSRFSYSPEPPATLPLALLGERVRPQLEVHHLARRPLAGLRVERRARAHRSEQSAALPPRLRIADAAVHPLRGEARGIRHAQHHPLAILQPEQAFRRVAGVDRRVLAEAERIVPVDPRVVARFRTAWLGHAFHLRERFGIERPALGTMLAGGLWSVQRPFALAAIEARHVPAGERRPEDTVAIDVAAARRVTGQRRLRPRGQRRLRRIGARIQSHDRARISEHASPDRSVGRRRDRVEAAAEAPVLRGIGRLVRLGVGVARAVAVRVHDQRRPAL